MLSTTSRRRFPALGAALLVAAATIAFLVPSAPATAAEGDATSAATVGVATRPAGEDGRPDGRSRFTFTAEGPVDSARVYSAHIVPVNRNESPKTAARRAMSM